MPDGIDDTTLLCEACGYVIEGVAVPGICPECGTPVSESLPSRRDRPPAVLGTLRRPSATFARLPIDSADQARIRAVLRCVTASMIFYYSYALGAAPGLIVRSGWAEGVFWLLVQLVGGILAGSAGGMLLFALTFIESIALRVVSGSRGFRFTRDVSMTVCSHACAGWIAGSLVWALGFSLLGLEAIVSSGVSWRGPSAWLGTAGLALIVLGGLIGLAAFQWLSLIGLRQCRFANRIPSPG